MTETILTPRIMANTDWATLLFVFSFLLIAVTRTVFEKRFGDFARLIISDKYIKVYKDSGHVMGGFNTILFIVQVISISFFIQLCLSHYSSATKTDWILYIRIFTLTATFILAKFLIDKIIATAFNIEDAVEQFNMRKVSYRSYIALLLLPLNIIVFYSGSLSDLVLFCIISTVLLVNLLTYLLSLKYYQNFIVGKLFYFILYLCALEIAPYYFMYYWFTKS